MSGKEIQPVNVWQRGVPVEGPLLTGPMVLALVLAGIGTVLAGSRLIGGLGPFAGMSDAYAWGVWKTFNVMTLTALGSGGLAVGFAAWVFNKTALHITMRTALVTSFLFYATGLLALGTDVGRPWNMYHLLFPWNWNTHSALFEVALAMPLYCVVFLAFENSPAIAERLWHTGGPKWKAIIVKVRPFMRRIYPYMIAMAYLLPLGHQSSLGALMLLAGEKLHPLYQTPLLPLLYLIQAGVCGLAFVIFILMASCLTWRRPLDMRVVGQLASILSWVSLGWLGLRAVDLVARGVLPEAFSASGVVALFWVETLAVLAPAVLLRKATWRKSPRRVFQLAGISLLGGLMYRFTPTTIAFSPAEGAAYFPTIPELFITVGLIALALIGYMVAVKRLAILPAPLTEWFHSVEHGQLHYMPHQRGEQEAGHA